LGSHARERHRAAARQRDQQVGLIADSDDAPGVRRCWQQADRQQEEDRDEMFDAHGYTPFPRANQNNRYPIETRAKFLTTHWWHIARRICEASLYGRICDSGERAVRCSVTWDDEMGYFYIEEFRHRCYSSWQDG
jgi:hypothetical protein